MQHKKLMLISLFFSWVFFAANFKGERQHNMPDWKNDLRKKKKLLIAEQLSIK
jgi:hypothetical protein